MALQIRQLHPFFAGEATGIELRDLTDRTAIDEIAAALDRHAVLVFRDLMLDDEHQIAFSRLFGPLETPIGKIRKDRKQRLRKELADISNLDENNNIRAASDRWRIFAEHSIFHSRSLVGYTEFSDEERAALPPVRQPVVRFHPGSERRALYLGSHASHVIGWPAEQGRALLDELTAFATQARFVYQHRWRVGDLIMWDNRCTLHRARPFDGVRYRRDLRRTTVEDSAPALLQSRSCLTAGI